GATILGCGGGGSPEWGRSILLRDLEKGVELKIVSYDELPEDKLVACAYFCGPIAPPNSRRRRSRGNPGYIEKALETVKEFIGELGGVIPTEIGGGNTATALHVAGLLGVPLVDADVVGRSVPELIHNSFIVYGRKIVPAILSSSKGDLLFIKDYSSVDTYEKLARSLSVISNGDVFVIDSIVPVKRAKEITVKESISKALKLGKIVYDYSGDITYLINKLLEVLEGFLIFKGELTEINLEVKEGFLEGFYMVKGVEEYHGSLLRIWVKNENMMAWKDDKPVVMTPDLIILLDEKGRGVVNSRLKPGMKVYVIGAKAPSIWRTEKGLELLGPKHFGFNYDYIPVEDLVALMR
ncbi:MAG TPA: DUF917 domain-containing protein, partial [Thermoproteales archaeon]|nr:DUF917 domain-containing protein [Thermoproteales archaeon]